MTLSQTLFDDIPRSYKGPANRSEPSFDYLNRSARLDVDRVRHVLEGWFSHFPMAARPDLRSRFRLKDDRQHLGAFFELYLHELLCRLGMNIEVHPTSSNVKKTRPDFKVLKGRKPIFYLEATLAASSDTEVSTENIESRVYDVLDRMDSPNFFVSIGKGKGAPTTAPPAGKIRHFLEQKLKDLDPDAVARQLEHGGLRALPLWTWQHEGWKITFRPIPKSPEARGKPGVRPIGAHMETSWVAPQEGIHDAVRKKATRYGSLDLPYIIAVNVLDTFVDQDAIVEALVGDECIVATLHEDGSVKHRLSRKPNGAFYGPQGPQNTRVSGTLMFYGLRPWNVATQEPVLWHHPWTSRPLAPETWPLPQMVFDSSSSQMVKREGLEVAVVLGLPPGWPRSLSD